MSAVPRHLHITLPTVRAHPREIPPRTLNLHLRSIQGCPAEFIYTIILYPASVAPRTQYNRDSPPSSGLRDFRSSTLPHAQISQPQIQGFDPAPSDGLRDRLFSEYVMLFIIYIQTSTLSIPNIYLFSFFRRRRPDHPRLVKYIHVDGSIYHRCTSNRASDSRRRDAAVD